jgi:hypothetical protein
LTKFENFSRITATTMRVPPGGERGKLFGKSEGVKDADQERLVEHVKASRDDLAQGIEQVLVWFYPKDHPYVELPMPSTIDRETLFRYLHEYHILPHKQVATQALRLANIDPNGLESHPPKI